MQVKYLHIRSTPQVQYLEAAYSLFAGSVPAAYSLFGTVLAFNLFLIFIEFSQMFIVNCRIKFGKETFFASADQLWLAQLQVGDAVVGKLPHTYFL